jgi:hypothetical protein
LFRQSLLSHASNLASPEIPQVGYFALLIVWRGLKSLHEIHQNSLMDDRKGKAMKSFEIAFWMAVLAGATFVYQVHMIHGQNEEAAALTAQWNNNQNPGAGTYAKAIFDGATLGAFADDGIFTEANKNEAEAKQITVQWADLQSRNENSIWYRNVGFIAGIIALVAGFRLKKQTLRS